MDGRGVDLPTFRPLVSPCRASDDADDVVLSKLARSVQVAEWNWVEPYPSRRRALKYDASNADRVPVLSRGLRARFDQYEDPADLIQGINPICRLVTILLHRCETSKERVWGAAVLAVVVRGGSEG